MNNTIKNFTLLVTMGCSFSAVTMDLPLFREQHLAARGEVLRNKRLLGDQFERQKRWHSKIYQAALELDGRKIEEQLAEGADINMRLYGYPLIIQAISDNRPEVVRILAEHGANINRLFMWDDQFSTPLLFALANNIKMVGLLIELGAGNYKAGTQIPFSQSSLDKLIELLEAAIPYNWELLPEDIAQINKTISAKVHEQLFSTPSDPPEVKTEARFEPVVAIVPEVGLWGKTKEFFSYFNKPAEVPQAGVAAPVVAVDRYELLSAAKNGSTEQVGFLLGQVDINESRNGETALSLAIKNGHKDFVRILLENGAVIDAPCITIHTTYDAPYQYTPLIYAIQLGKDEMAEFLLDQGARFVAINGLTPIQNAAGLHNIKMVKILKNWAIKKGIQLPGHDLEAIQLMEKREAQVDRVANLLNFVRVKSRTN